MDTFVNLIPFALVALICPVMMWLMMRGMHHDSEHHDHKPDPEGRQKTGGAR